MECPKITVLRMALSEVGFSASRTTSQFFDFLSPLRYHRCSVFTSRDVGGSYSGLVFSVFICIMHHFVTLSSLGHERGSAFPLQHLDLMYFAIHLHIYGCREGHGLYLEGDRRLWLVHGVFGTPSLRIRHRLITK